MSATEMALLNNMRPISLYCSVVVFFYRCNYGSTILSRITQFQFLLHYCTKAILMQYCSRHWSSCVVTDGIVGL
jgi:hypothetical protein